MAETREQMAARLEDYADAWANEGTPDTVTALRAGAAALRAQGWQPIQERQTAALERIAAHLGFLTEVAKLTVGALVQSPESDIPPELREKLARLVQP